jgi:hypothetical protein
MKETRKMDFARAAALGAILATAATGAFAKAHDQGQTAVPGENVQEETVAPAQTLGERLGDAMGFRRLSGNPPPGDAKKDK